MIWSPPKLKVHALCLIESLAERRCNASSSHSPSSLVMFRKHTNTSRANCPALAAAAAELVWPHFREIPDHGQLEKYCRRHRHSLCRLNHLPVTLPIARSIWSDRLSEREGEEAGELTPRANSKHIHAPRSQYLRHAGRWGVGVS